MAQQTINIGTTANDGTGDQLRDAFNKTNLNFTDLYDTLVANIYSGNATVVRVTAPVTPIGTTGDLPGMIASDSNSIWLCIAAYDGTSNIWIQLNSDVTIDHNDIMNVGTNDHLTIDTHIAAANIHFLQSDIVTTINNQTGTAYTLVLGDRRSMVRMNNAAANVVTIPDNATVAFPIGTTIEVSMAGTGVTTIAITADTLNGVTTLAQHDVVKLTKVAATEWIAA